MGVGKNLKDAAIAGHDGNVWAKSANFNVTPGEIQNILQNYDCQHNLASTGINLGGQKYFYLSGDEEVMRGKQGKGGVHLVKTNQALLVGVYDAPMEPSAAATVTEKLGDPNINIIIISCEKVHHFLIGIKGMNVIISGT